MDTVCGKMPERCAPRDIKIVNWDADDTMWHIEPYAIASNLHGPFKLVDPDTLIVESGESPSTTYKKAKPAKPKAAKYNFQQKGIEEWWKSNIGPIKDEELKDLSNQLFESLSQEEQGSLSGLGKLAGQPVEVTPVKPARELINLADIQGWNPEQRKSVDRLFNLYGKRGCKVLEVSKEKGELNLDCDGDKWLLKKDGSLIEQYPQGWVDTARPSYDYQPKPITIKLLPTFRQTLDELEKRGIKSTIISLNTPGTVKAIVKAFGLAERFTEINDTWENKGNVFDDIAKRQKVCPCNMMFVDNTLSHVEDVSKKCGLSVQIGQGKDVEKPIQILNYILPKSH